MHMNTIVQIVENLKIEYIRLKKIPADSTVTYDDISFILELSKNTINKYVQKAMIPHQAILTFCYKYKINFNDIYYREVQKICIECHTRITDKNRVVTTSNRKDKAGNYTKIEQRKCVKCYNKYRAENKKKSESKKTHCLCCKKRFDEHNNKKQYIEYTLKSGKTIRRANSYCSECLSNPALIEQSKLERKRESYARSQREKGILPRCDRGSVDSQKNQSKKSTKKNSPKKSVEIKIESVKKALSEAVPKEMKIAPKVEKISKAKAALKNLIEEKKERKKIQEELSLEEKLIKQYLKEK